MQKNIELKVIAIYVVVFVVVMATIQQLWVHHLFDSANFLHWDAEHYENIKSKGYYGYRVAFFPLFPWIWKLLHLDVLGVVLFNSTVFLLSFYYLIKELKISCSRELLLYLSIPSFIFFYLPYSESIFFLASIFILLGLKNEKNSLLYFGLFVSILARPAFTVFIPSLIITEFLGRKKENRLKRIFIYLAIVIVGLCIVSILQYLDTGEWFKFFEAQKIWGNHLQIPTLPLKSWAGGLILRTDAFAFLIGTMVGCFLLALILNVNRLREKKIPSEVVFSLAYLAGITLLVLLFRGGSLFSLNRFVFATPFIIVVVNYWIRQDFHLSLKQLFIIFWLINFFWLLFGSYTHLREILKFSLLSFYVLLIFVLKVKSNSLQKYSIVIFILVNFVFQILFYLRFLKGGWMG